MSRQWTFGRKIAAGFLVMVVLNVAVGLIATLTLRSVVSSKDDVIDRNARLLVDAEKLEAASLGTSVAARGFLLTGEERFVTSMTQTRKDFAESLAELKRTVSTADERRLAGVIEAAEIPFQRALDSVISLRRTGASTDAVGRAFAQQVDPKRITLTASIRAFVSHEEQQLARARQASSDTASTATTLVAVIAVASLVAAVVLAYLLTRTLRRLVGTTVGEVQSSSAELQTTANQQATGAKEQATAMNEINTTISELLATARQIAESAQRVAQVAGRTAEAGRSGEATIDKAQQSVADIRRQVDVIVNHMLELGDKSQQIGAVLDIVTELAEQTNILAINSTIEAAGAGEAGKRFAVVAEEIRKLADRVAGSTKEIRGLIDVVRGAVNTTVMATEIGSKAVDAGSKQFEEVASSFREIADLVTSTTEAAREIELSTKQQTTAVEQVNIAIGSVAQAAKESEASTGQTLQTASQLTTLSRALQRMVEPQAGG